MVPSILRHSMFIETYKHFNLDPKWWMNRNKRAEEPAYIPPRPAHEIAMEKLASLEQSGWLDKEDYKTYQSELTYILREYLEGRFNIQAMESTTAEIIKQMERQKLKPPKH